MPVVLLSNNPKISALSPPNRVWGSYELISPQVLRAGISEKAEGYFCGLFDGLALSVLLAARDLVHVGYKLLGHPLYGNFRPHQQPYRTLLLQFQAARPPASARDARPVPTDEYSLHLMEEAISVYQSVPGLSPDQAPPAFLDDCALLDYELMRLTLKQAGWPVPDSGHGAAAGGT